MKLVPTRDGILEASESVPTPEQRALGKKILQARIKKGSKASFFLKLEPHPEKERKTKA